MTHKRFWDDPYQAECETRVDSVDGDRVTLEETIFFAFSGGQEGDRGTIGGHAVLRAEKTGRELVYTLPADHGLTPGDPVQVRIDWDRRYRLMRNHFAAELTLELVCQTLAGIQKIGAHISEDKARIDFSWPENISACFPVLLEKAGQIIDRNPVIASRYSDPAAERRYWEISGFARVSCGGTHLRRAGEVGKISLRRKNIGRGKERIEVYTGVA